MRDAACDTFPLTHVLPPHPRQEVLTCLPPHPGNKWADMAKYIHGRTRTDNAIKNHWNSSLRRGRNIEHLLDQNGALPTQFPQGLPEQPACTWVREGRVACGPGATTTLEPTFAFKRAVYDA